MGRRLFMILGNGFTIDFLSHINKLGEIDVQNLFRYGSYVKWPVDGEPGFLSFKHCPNLWNLGARPHMSDDEAMALIENIITCVNVFVSSPRPSLLKTGRPKDIYIDAYKELALYLKHLFIYYDGKVTDLPKTCHEWSWCRFFQHVAQSERYSTVTVVTYNYDVWLERVLLAFKIPFNIGLVGRRKPGAKITILKPHGSISFAHRQVLDRHAFSVSLNRELLDGKAKDFVVRYDDLDANHLVTAMIPPAGDSGRFNRSWAGAIRRKAKHGAGELGPDDDIMVCGLSYWHVDRAELDELLVNCDPSASVKMVNPQPSPSLSAVITSIFNNYITYTSARVLEDFIT